MVNVSFWANWYYDDDLDMWAHDDEQDDFQWIIDRTPDELSTDYKENFEHDQHKYQVIQNGWEIINSLAVHEEEKGKQEWNHIGLIIDSKDINKIVAVFYESNFDIYRETHIEFKQRSDEYKYVNLYYEIA